MIFFYFVGVSVEFQVNQSVVPVRQPYRRIPAPLENKVNQKLDELLRLGIIEKAEPPTTWLSAMVVEPKKDGDIRICLDMRLVNKAIEREKHPMPTIEEILSRVAKSKFFSSLDISNAFHQVEIAENSRHVTTFITSKGLFRYKRLLFGISCAPEKFQKILEEILAGCEGALNFIDDILVFGSDKQEHGRRLSKVLKRLQEYGILLNEKKCIYGAKEVVFLGFHFSERGLSITESKLEAVRALKAPTNVNELRGVLGFVNFLKRFVPDMSTITAPINKLLKNDEIFRWGKEEQASFDELKRLLSKSSTLGYYDADDRTEVIADASPVGLGAVLVQFDKDNSPRIICYASKSLSAVERRYAQLEKEALALVWSVERFHFYLYGKQFYLVTDHRPLEVIFGPRSKPCLRIERWVLRLQSYDYKVVYRPGKENIADPFSRLCQNEPSEKSFDEISEAWIGQICEVTRPKAIKMVDLEAASREDEMIKSVKQAITSGNWGPELKSLQMIRFELCTSGDLLLRGARIVIPESLQQRTLDLAHGTHCGEAGMKQLLRTKVWWPGIDKMVGNYVKRCRECLLNSLPENPEPMKRKELPLAPWVDVAADFLGPLPTKEYLLIVLDYYSRYQEIEIMKETTAIKTIEACRRIFGRCGFPVSLTTDNGPQFTSAEFKAFCEEVGITQNFAVPYWPQQNGGVERQNRDVLKFIRSCHAGGLDWKTWLPEYILNKHTKPNETTGQSPGDLFYNRKIRNKIPGLVDSLRGIDDQVRDRDREMKQKGKERADEARHAKTAEVEVGDHVFVKNLLKKDKLSTNFSPDVHEVLVKKGGDVVVKNCSTGKFYRRNIAHLKKIPPDAEFLEKEKEDGEGDKDEDVPKIMLKRTSENSWEIAGGSGLAQNEKRSKTQ